MNVSEAPIHLLPAAGRKPLPCLDHVRSVVSRFEGNALPHLNQMASLRDENTGAHTMRMASYSGAIAAAWGMGPRQVRLLVAAAPLHDIGKIGIPDHILNKPGPLTEEERAVMQLHPVLGHRLLSGTGSVVLQMGAEIALAHHERWDGRGYPHRLSGEAIPLSARFVALADGFDALTTARPYKRAWSVEQALAIIEADAGHYDPAILRAFERALPAVLGIKASFEAGPGFDNLGG